MTTLLGGSGDAGQGGNAGAAGNAGGSTPTPAAGGGTGNAGGGGAGGAGNGGGNWRDSLPDDLKGNPILEKYSDVPNLAKALIHAQSTIGKKGVIPPSDGATPEEIAGFYKQLGLPDLEKYDVKLPDGVEVNAERLKSLKEVAHKNGILPKQAQALIEWQLSQEQEVMKDAKAKRDAALKDGMDGLKKEWGQGWDKNVAAARLAVEELGGKDFREFLEKTGLGNDPLVVRFAAKAGALMGEDKIRGHVPGGGFGQTPAEIQKEINDVMGNSSHPYFNPRHPAHRSAVQDMEERYKRLSGGV